MTSGKRSDPESRIDRLEEYASLNSSWAAGMKKWGDKITHEVFGEGPKRTSEEPPKPPKWPPPKTKADDK